MGLFGKKKDGRRVNDPPFGERPAAPPPPDPLGLPEFLARLRLGDRTPLSPAHVADAAKRLGVPLAVFRAVMLIEVGEKEAFAANGLPMVTFEPHVFAELTGGKHNAANPDVSYAEADPRRIPAAQELRWKQLAKAFVLDREAALKATSWGMFEMLGLYHEDFGFSTVASFVASISGSEARQLEAFEAFLHGQGLVALLKAKNWAGFAAHFGDGPQAKVYAGQLARTYKMLTSRMKA